MGEASETGTTAPKSGAFAWIRKVDDVVFSVEKSIVAFALITITVVVFIDVIARRITAPDSKVGQLLSRIARIDDTGTREWVDANVAPWVSMVLAVLLVGFGFYSSRRFARARRGDQREVDLNKEIGLSVAAAILSIMAGYAFAYVFEALESWMVYAGTFAITSIAFAVYYAVRKPERWQVHAAAGAAAGAALVWLCLPLHGEDSVSYVPEGYTWSKMVSLALLLWVGLLSASICVHAGKHIRMGAAQKLVPEKARKYLDGSGFLAAALFCALMTYLGFDYLFAPKASTDEFMTELFTLGGTRYVYGFEGMIGRGGYLEGTQIPDWLGILAAPVGFGIATLRFIGAGISSFLGGSYGSDAAEEGMAEARELARKKKEAEEKEAEEKEAGRREGSKAPAPAPRDEEEE